MANITIRGIVERFTLAHDSFFFSLSVERLRMHLEDRLEPELHFLSCKRLNKAQFQQKYIRVTFLQTII